MTTTTKRHALNLSRIVGGGLLALAGAQVVNHIARNSTIGVYDVKVFAILMGVGVVLCFPGLAWSYAQIILPKVSFGKASKDEDVPEDEK